MRADISMAAEVRASIAARIELWKQKADPSMDDVVQFWQARVSYLDRMIAIHTANDLADLANKTMGRR